MGTAGKVPGGTLLVMTDQQRKPWPGNGHNLGEVSTSCLEDREAAAAALADTINRYKLGRTPPATALLTLLGNEFGIRNIGLMTYAGFVVVFDRHVRDRKRSGVIQCDVLEYCLNAIVRHYDGTEPRVADDPPG